MIKQDTIRKIIDTVQIEEIVGEFVRLKKRGVNYIGLCPFHTEKTPSFTVSPAKGIYKCFGCGKAGDSIRFVMEHDQLTYPEALRFLAQKLNIEVEETEQTEEEKEAGNLRESLYILNGFAKDYFTTILTEDEKGRAIGYSYFVDRGFDDKTMDHFGLGYCTEDYDRFSKAALKAGYKKEFLDKSGLTIFKDDKMIDRFRGRVIFPIHNLSGRVIGFGGRTLRSDKKIAKYVNSPESEVYSKSQQLYGLYQAKKSVVEADLAYLVEGYTDVVSLYQSGVGNAVAPLGTSLTQDQVRLIKRYTQNIALLFDGDEAGVKASERAIDMALQEGLNVKVIAFPEGQDPDSYSKEHSDEELRQFLESNAQDFIDYKLSLHNKEWKSDPIKKAGLMKSIIESISKIPDHLLRSLYVKDFSQKADIDEKSVIFELNRFRRGSLKSRYNTEDILPEPQDVKPDQSQEGLKDFESSRQAKEEKVIELLFKYGLLHLPFKIDGDHGPVEEITMLTAEYIIGELEKDEIQIKEDRFDKIYQTYKVKLESGAFPEHRDFLEHENDQVRELSYHLLSSQYELSNNWKDKYYILTKLEGDNLKADVTRALYAMKLSEVLERLADFEERMKAAEEEEVMQLMEHTRRLSEAKKALAHKLGMTLT